MKFIESIGKALKYVLDHVFDNLDKFILVSLFIWIVHETFIFVAMHANPEIVSWAKELASGFQGALLGLITGVALGKRMMESKDVSLSPKPLPPSPNTGTSDEVKTN